MIIPLTNWLIYNSVTIRIKLNPLNSINTMNLSLYIYIYIIYILLRVSTSIPFFVTINIKQKKTTTCVYNGPIPEIPLEIHLETYEFVSWEGLLPIYDGKNVWNHQPVIKTSLNLILCPIVLFNFSKNHHILCIKLENYINSHYHIKNLI